jgi:hypothetical protein
VSILAEISTYGWFGPQNGLLSISTYGWYVEGIGPVLIYDVAFAGAGFLQKSDWSAAGP